MPHGEMTTSRLEAFSDGVIAIIVTIMVLELRSPSPPTWPALLRITPLFLSYGLRFLVVAIMWVNHHHLVHAVREVTAGLLWSNLNLLFWMSLVPFVTEFLGKNYHQPMAVALYGWICHCAEWRFFCCVASLFGRAVMTRVWRSIMRACNTRIFCRRASTSPRLRWLTFLFIFRSLFSY